jgi:hypothetical protein
MIAARCGVADIDRGNPLLTRLGGPRPFAQEKSRDQ